MNFNQVLGIKLVRRYRDGVAIEIALRPDMLNYSGALHGGVTAALADVAVGTAITEHFKGLSKATTTEMKINYLLPVTGGKLVARAHLVRIGKTLCVGRVDVRDTQRRLVAVALVTYMLLTVR